VTARVVHRVVVLESRAGEFDGAAQLLGPAHYLFEFQRDLLAAGHRWSQTHHVDVRDDGTRGRHHHVMSGAGEFPIRRCELLGPVAGGMPRPVGKCPVTRCGHHEQDRRHGSSLPRCPGTHGLDEAEPRLRTAASRPSNTSVAGMSLPHVIGTRKTWSCTRKEMPQPGWAGASLAFVPAYCAA